MVALPITPFLQQKKLNSLSGVSSSNNATAELPVRGTYYDLWLEVLTSADAAVAVADMKSELSNIILRVNGEIVVDLSPTYLLMLQQFYGGAFGANNRAGVIPIFFQRRPLVLPLEKSVFALGTQNVDSITLEVKCGTLTNVNKINVHARVSDEVRPLGQHIRVQKFPYSFASTGIHEVSTLPKDPRSGLLGFHIQTPGTSTIKDVTVTVNTNDIIQTSPDAIQQSILEASLRDPQTGFYHVAVDLMNAVDSFLPFTGVQDFRIKTNWATAAPNSHDYILERIWGLNLAA